MRILIFGASGFIGAHLTRYAASRGYEVVTLCRSGSVAGFNGKCLKWTFGAPLAHLAAGTEACRAIKAISSAQGTTKFISSKKNSSCASARSCDRIKFLSGLFTSCLQCLTSGRSCRKFAKLTLPFLTES